MAAATSFDIRLPVVSYTPSMWGDTFTTFSLDVQVQQEYAEAIEELKDEALSMLMAKGNSTSDKLVLINTLERLGVAYHFYQQIEDTLQQIFKLHSQDDYDLFTTALQFRLLRQHRLHVSCDVFDKFKDHDNKFKEALTSDAKGLLSLYEAAHLRIHGEEILEEAVVFTTHHLNRMARQLESPLEDQVKRALQTPLHRGVSRIEAHYYISFYEKDESRNELLLKLAKLDYNYVQSMHKNELSQLSRWWKAYDLQSKLPYARDRVVEAFLWATAFHFEPQYSYSRVAIAKAILMLTIMDDTYDNYATIQEGDLFTEVLQRWNIGEIDQLPDYMKIIYRLTLSIYDDLECEAAERGQSFAVSYAKETVKRICSAYNQDLKWFVGGQMPAFEDYLVNITFTSCLYVLCSVSIPGMKSVTKETIDWLMSEPKIIKASAKMCRFLDDLGSYERESKQGQIQTAVDWYMKQHGLSKQETEDKFVELAEDAWKDLNREWMLSSNNSWIPKDMVEQVANYARSAEVHYRSRQDGFSRPQILAPLLVALFVDPIII